MLKAILKLLLLREREKKGKADRLYYLYGLHRINEDRRVYDECTITKE